MSQKTFDKDLVVIRKRYVTLILNKPAYIGICILDLSKELTCGFHYDFIKNKYGNNSRLFTDTDRLMYEIKSDDVYKDFSKDKELFQSIMTIQTNYWLLK